MPNPEYPNGRPETSLIPKEFLGRTIGIISGNGGKILELRCERKKRPRGFFESIFGRNILGRKSPDESLQPMMMTLSLLTVWGGGVRNILTASVKENPATGERKLGVSLNVLPEDYLDYCSLKRTLGAGYRSENDGCLVTVPRKPVVREVLQLLADKGVPDETSLPQRIDLEATIEGFLEFFQETLERQEAGDLPDDFPLPTLVAIP